jgi:hypothetical protein
MAPPAPLDLKKALRAAGFEVYRTLDTHVVLAERVRDNLIMDSGVAAGTGAELSVQVVVRAQRSHFPGADETAVLGHARRLAEAFEQRGYRAEGETRSELQDPSDPERVLDTSFEIALRRGVSGLEPLLEELRAALAARRYTGED